MKRSSLRRIAAAVGGVLVCAAGVNAQGAAQQVVPLELVRMLVVGFPFGGDEAGLRVMVGGIPDATKSVVPIPADARVVGSFVFDRVTRSALALAAAPDSVRRLMERSLADAGWERFRPPQQRGGFAARDLSDALQFCLGDSTSVNLGLMANPDGGSYLTITHLRDAEYASICRRAEERFPERQRSPIPTLLAPEGARQRGGGSGGGGDSWDAHTRLQTSMSVHELLMHYDAQLRAAGWAGGATAMDDGLIVRTYGFTDEDDAEWKGVFTVSAPAAGIDRFLSVLAIRAQPIR